MDSQSTFPLVPFEVDAYQPRPVPHFTPERIILTRGSLHDEKRRTRVEGICGVYPHAEVIEKLDTSHNRIVIDGQDPLDIHYRGKRTLVLGEHRSALRFSSEEGNTCPNYWHFSPYGFCPFDCKYCYLAGTPGVRFSPAVKIFLNLREMLSQIEEVAGNAEQPTAFYLGKLQDGLALDPLTGYTRTLIPFFAAQRFARLTLLTKSADIENLLDLDHRGHTINFTDSATPTRKAKPAGVLGAEIWVNVLAVGQPTPTDPASFTFVALDTRTPYTLDFAGADGGKNAHYLLRWVNPTGEKGPWSETASATIGA